MKSAGLNLWQIASPVLLISFVLVCVCLYNNCVVYPKTTYANRRLIQSMGVEDPIKLLEEGRFMREFPGYMIYVGKKNKNRVRELIVYEVDEDSGKVTGTIRADSGIMTADRENALLKIDLFDVRIEIPSLDAPDDASKTRYVSARKYPIRLDFNELMGSEKVTKKRKNLTVSELAWRIRHPEKEYAGMTREIIRRMHNNDLIELNQRICLSIAPFVFVLMAIPLGIKSHRKESSVGMLISLGIVFIYYLFIILSEAFDENLAMQSWIFPWIPLIGSQIAGLILLKRAN
jgi:lipopolysaccharide export system permease protein